VPTVDTGLLAQSLGTDDPPILHPPLVDLEFSVNGTGITHFIVVVEIPPSMVFKTILTSTSQAPFYRRHAIIRPPSGLGL
jgi:hypothetical protein